MPITRARIVITERYSLGMLDQEPRGALRQLLRSLRARVEYEHAAGTRWMAARASDQTVRSPGHEGVALPKPPGTAGVSSSIKAQAAAQPGKAAAAQPGEPGSLDDLRAHIGDCQRCNLAAGRTNLVFGVGNPDADLMFVGEGPGRDEDRRGEPFVGRAGQLLTDIITNGMKLTRADVYIANVVKCRPPENRNPEPDEIASCMPFLQQQIALVRPRVVVALGTFAAQTLLGVRTPIFKLRGTWHEYRGVKVMPTLHPAYLLRSPGDKRLVWDDIQQVMAELGLKT